MSELAEHSNRPTVTLEQLAQCVGVPGSVSEWIRIDQAMIDGFAAVTGDDAFIHVDPERAGKTRFGGTIAHGLLTLSLLPKLMRTATPLLEGVKMRVNYGFDRVRFVAPVPQGSRLRARFDLVELVETKPRFFRISYEVSVEIDGVDQPALVARWTLGNFMAGASSK